MTNFRTIKRALISLSDKTDAVEFAKSLAEMGVEIISTGGTAKTLRQNSIAVIDVSAVTGFPEMMDGRVKTLHPKIHGAFLALRDDPDHVASMGEHDIEPIDLVVINLYPFEQTIAKEGVTLEDAVENIDIGGPAMIRSASKNWRDVAVVTDPRLYDEILSEMRANQSALSLGTRRRLAVLAYTRTASYDLAISSYLAAQLSSDDLEMLEPLNPLGHLTFIESEDFDEAGEPQTEKLTLELAKVTDLRYGENPHQTAALYVDQSGTGIAAAEQLHGKEMSYNNYIDADAAWKLVQDFDRLAVAIIKHTNPSGVGLGSSNHAAYKRALSTDPVSAFGGIVALNTTVDVTVAAEIIEVFTEVVIAPDYDDEAVAILSSKKNLRVLRMSSQNGDGRDQFAARQYKQISGGMLVQDPDIHRMDAAGLHIVSEKPPTQPEINAMLLAWDVCKHVKSNAIVLANENQTLGVGAGQMNRVDSVRIAAMRAERFDLPIG
ncbi:MAG: bifunctional phosphoribosylaminoimidazolecarboxamide formyltransferase/IMP cyclohydrolase, partial [Blastocatellia bacterium]|nr:bifunctional phosphoribosylaminoimidazolecarboxamide formyltransferase/IMP cyclohydrolase [Blastocatellia bacterium]